MKHRYNNDLKKIENEFSQCNYRQIAKLSLKRGQCGILIIALSHFSKLVIYVHLRRNKYIVENSLYHVYH